MLEQNVPLLPQLSQAHTAATLSPTNLSQTSAGAAPDAGTLLTFLWMFGAATVLLIALWKNLRFLRRIRRNAVPVEVRCPLPVYLSEALSSPCLCGLFRPAIFLCDKALDSQAQLDMTLEDELSHWRSGDRFWAVLRLLCCAAHWFNPLVWIAARTCVQDCEHACDHRVLRCAGQAEREAYGILLLSYMGLSPARNDILLTSSPVGAGELVLRARIALIGQKPATRRTALAVLLLCVSLACLAACTGRLTDETGCQQLIRLARLADTTAAVKDVNDEAPLGCVSGTTFANFLNTRAWEQAAAAEIQNLQLTLEYEVSLCGGSGEELGTLRFWSDMTTADRYASAEFPDETDAEPIYYGASIWDEQTTIAMAMIDKEESTLCSTLSGGEEMVLVCLGPALGTEYHFLFCTENSTDYTPISSDLDAQYSRVAERMLFISRDVGFVSFRFEEINGYSAPNLYRTADGGVTWQRITLPMGEISTENGYSGIHVTAMEFQDEQSGSITVSMYNNGQQDTLSCSFVTSDGGRTWAAVTSDDPLRSD